IFQQDNACPHTTHVSKDRMLHVEVLPWSARSPIFFQIEHVWDLLGCQL
uniref:Tc1-like transposase DDE domain-containing protein n=1 Tax=Kryptolebias marmoratus TaxID=37003 RepID=A0A3Q3BM84_KRYMA